jgi:peptide/nickel transport system substrate-binding protein
VHVTLVSRWLDPGETEALITPFMVLYTLHDALLKPMPGNISAPSLAESWTLAKDGVTYEFVLRRNAKFHNGDPVTSDDVKITAGHFTLVQLSIRLPRDDHPTGVKSIVLIA